MQQEESKGSNGPSKHNATAFLSSQQVEMLSESRRDKFLAEFTQSHKYVEIRGRLQEAILLLGVEKFKRQMGAGRPLDAATKNKFKAELYIFLQKKLKEYLKEAIGQAQRGSLPADIVSQFDSLQSHEHQLVEASFTEDSTSKHKRLAEEFDIICDMESTEREYVNQLVANKTDADKWYEFALFSLKYKMQAKAEQYLDCAVALQGGMTPEMHIMYAALMLQRKNLAKTKYHLDIVLDQDWKNIHANILYGFYYKMTEWHEMSRKHFAIAKVKRMRDLGILPPKSSIPKNFRTEAIDFKVEIIDYQKLKTHDENLTPKENDLIFFELVDFLLQRQVYGTADIALEYISDRLSSRYLMTKAKIRIF